MILGWPPSSETTGPISTKLLIFYQNMPNLHNQYISAERKISEKKPEYMRLPTKMEAKLKIEKRGDEILIVHCCFSVSQNELSFGHLKRFLFLVTVAILNGGQGCRTHFERDPPRDHPCQVWFNLVQRFQRRRFKCDLLSK
jgi:hypothetical protein